MAHLVKPFIEEPVHWLAGGLFDSDTKLRRFDRLVGVLRQVMIDGTPPVVLAQKRAQHVQHSPAPRISIGVEDGVRIRVVLRYDRTPLAPVPCGKVLVLI